MNDRDNRTEKRSEQGGQDQAAGVTAFKDDVLYRFWFYDWLFKDVSRGTMWERAAAGQHNREQARWLPTYMGRWTFMMFALFGVAAFCELLLLSPVLSAFFYVPSILTVPYNVVAGIAWIFLSRG